MQKINKIVFSFLGEPNEPFSDWLKEIWDRTQKMELNRFCDDPACVYCKMRLDQQ